MVCVNYKDIDYLKDECEDGRRLGFGGKVNWLSSITTTVSLINVNLHHLASDSSQSGRGNT